MNDLSFTKKAEGYVAEYLSQGKAVVQIHSEESGNITVMQFLDGMPPVKTGFIEFSKDKMFLVESIPGVKVRLLSSVPVKQCKWALTPSMVANCECPEPYTLPAASESELGGVKIGYTTSGKNYAVQLDGSGKAFVNVPWADTDTKYQQATDSALGLIKIGYSTSGKNYAVQLDGSGKAFVNVPWADTDTKYQQATDSALGLIKIGYSTSGKNYAVQLDGEGKAYVNVPWTDGDTKYQQATDSALGLIKIGYSTSGKNYAVQLDGSGKAFVNVPWTDTDTKYSQATSSLLGLVKQATSVQNATSAEDVVTKFNQLLENLRVAGTLAR